MGWDISYHPIAPDEIASVYFAGLDDSDRVDRLIAAYGIGADDAGRLRRIFERARELDPHDPFPQTHGFFLAIVAGFLRPFWYVRGSALSFLSDDPDFRAYFSDWKTLVPEKHTRDSFENVLLCNYCGGVFLAPDAVKALKRDYEEKPDVRKKLDQLFSDGRLNIFWKGVDYALDHNLGLLEAAEVIEPFPFNLEQTKCYAILSNCDPAGAILYQHMALEQTRSLEATGRAKGEKRTRAPGVLKRFFGTIFYRPD